MYILIAQRSTSPTTLDLLATHLPLDKTNEILQVLLRNPHCGAETLSYLSETYPESLKALENHSNADSMSDSPMDDRSPLLSSTPSTPLPSLTKSPNTFDQFKESVRDIREQETPREKPTIKKD